MPRTARLRAPGLPLHIVHRGHNGEACFRTERDFERYLEVLEEASALYHCLVHAFVLMTNHVHLLVTPQEALSASLMMKKVAQKHAQVLNRREERVGSFWSDRFYSSVIQTDRYLLACHRYIELNPVRAGMVASPRYYVWSSYRHNAEGVACPILTPHSLYSELGHSAEARQRAYRSLFSETVDEAMLEQFRVATKSSRAVGDEDFHRELGGLLGTCTFARQPGRPRSVKVD
jgi:putative transposase